MPGTDADCTVLPAVGAQVALGRCAGMSYALVLCRALFLYRMVTQSCALFCTELHTLEAGFTKAGALHSAVYIGGRADTCIMAGADVYRMAGLAYVQWRGLMVTMAGAGGGRADGT